MPDTDLIERELRGVYPRPSAAATARARAAVVETSIDRSKLAHAVSVASGRSEWWRWRPVLVVAVAVAALVGVGVAIADGFGAFNGISAAQNTPTGSDVLPPALLAQVEQMNAENDNNGAGRKLLPDTARVLATTPAGDKVFGLTDAQGDLLCLLSVEGSSCGPPLTDSRPITMTGSNPSPTTGATFTAEGVAMDDVTSVSFTVSPGDGQEVTVPVHNNFWIYTEPDSHAVVEHCVVAHLADGSKVNPFPELPCP